MQCCRHAGCWDVTSATRVTSCYSCTSRAAPAAALIRFQHEYSATSFVLQVGYWKDLLYLVQRAVIGEDELQKRQQDKEEHNNKTKVCAWFCSGRNRKNTHSLESHNHDPCCMLACSGAVSMQLVQHSK